MELVEFVKSKLPAGDCAIDVRNTCGVVRLRDSDDGIAADTDPPSFLENTYQGAQPVAEVEFTRDQP